ncbi:MAG TPA: ATP-binding protein [Acidimicrobiales bacterium]|nr:ATP-binding protein [Acidimicrobiales bacterium]
MTASQPSSPTEDAFQTSFPPRTDALARARTAFSAWLRRRTQGETVDELEIVFSELAANAVDASPDGAEEVTGRAWCEGSELVLDLVNRTDATEEPVARWDLDDPLRAGGRGLVITEALVDSMEVRLAPGQRLVVRCRRRLE